MRSFYNLLVATAYDADKVVIPLQTRSFYNGSFAALSAECECCHTPPNEELLQRSTESEETSTMSCHTPPNEELLQHGIDYKMRCEIESCHTPPNEELLQPSGYVITPSVLSCHTPPNEELLQLNVNATTTEYTPLSYPSKRGASTTVKTEKGEAVT